MALGSTPWAGFSVGSSISRRSVGPSHVAGGPHRPVPLDVPASPARDRLRCILPRRPSRRSLQRRSQWLDEANASRRHVVPARGQRRSRDLDNEGIIPVLARDVREVETAVERGSAMPSVRTKFQVVALLVREERARIKADVASSEAKRAEQLKRLDGIATILAKTAARDPSLLTLLAEDAVVSDSAKTLKRDLIDRRPASRRLSRRSPRPSRRPRFSAATERRVVPQSVVSRQLANPFLVPDFTAAEQTRSGPRRLATWELLGPLFRSFEYGGSGAPACMPLPEPVRRCGPPAGSTHAAPGAGGRRRRRAATAPSCWPTSPAWARPPQALLAAQAANAYPLLVVVPNVVKTNWAREAGLWTPKQTGHRDPRQRRHHRRLRRHRHRQLRGARPARRLARRLRLPRHGRRRGALHQEQDVPALAARAGARRADPLAHRAAAADGADRHPADQRHRGLPGDLAVPRLDRRQEAAGRS